MDKKKNPYNDSRNGDKLTLAFVNTLGHFMKEKGVSMNQLARDSGVSVATISRILSYETQPKFGTLFELYNAMGVIPQITLHLKDGMEELKC